MDGDAPNTHDTLRAKVATIFTELAGGRAERLSASGHGTVTRKSVLATSLEPEFGSERAKEIGFHLADWGADAAFLVALHLCPERFTAEEVQVGVSAFLVHVPDHVAAAAAFAGCPVEDTFDVLPAAPSRAT